MDSIIQICSELSDLANIISNPGMYLQPIMSAMISELTLCHHKRLCCNCANGSRQKAHGRRVHLTFHPIPRNAETSSGGQLWQEHEDHCKPTCLLLIFERNKEEQPKTLEIQIESEESEPTHLDLILPPFLRRDRPGES